METNHQLSLRRPKGKLTTKAIRYQISINKILVSGQYHLITTIHSSINPSKRAGQIAHSMEEEELEQAMSDLKKELIKF